MTTPDVWGKSRFQSVLLNIIESGSLHKQLRRFAISRFLVSIALLVHSGTHKISKILHFFFDLPISVLSTGKQASSSRLAGIVVPPPVSSTKRALGKYMLNNYPPNYKY